MLSGVLPLVSSAVVQVCWVAVTDATGAPAAVSVQLVVKVGTTPASEASRPTGVAMIVSGVSADTENEPPHHAGMVQRTCGIRTWPGSPTLPPKSRVSLLASGSEKFEVA